MVKSLNECVKYIGIDDLDLDLFESQYILPEGIAYNSYLILDDKVAILDTVDARKGEAWKVRLAEALNGRKPDYLVVHHLEPDHSALIEWTLKTFPGLTLVAGAKALQMLPQFFDKLPLEGRTQSVKEGDVLPLGAHSLRFIGTMKTGPARPGAITSTSWANTACRCRPCSRRPPPCRSVPSVPCTAPSWS